MDSGEKVWRRLCDSTHGPPFFSLLFVRALESEPTPLYVLDKCSAAEPHSQAHLSFALKQDLSKLSKLVLNSPVAQAGLELAKPLPQTPE